jgi:hypothetical protein
MVVKLKKNKSPYMEAINRECPKDGKGRFKTMDVLRVSQRLYSEQQQVISALQSHLNSITKANEK